MKPTIGFFGDSVNPATVLTAAFRPVFVTKPPLIEEKPEILVWD